MADLERNNEKAETAETENLSFSFQMLRTLPLVMRKYRYYPQYFDSLVQEFIEKCVNKSEITNDIPINMRKYVLYKQILLT